MKFMILIYGSEEAWAAIGKEEADEIGATHRKIQDSLRITSELVDHKELALEDAWIVGSVGGSPSGSQGPLRAGGLILGGYYLVDCSGRDRAAEIASQFKEAEFAPIEVRRLSGETTWDNGSPSVE